MMKHATTMVLIGVTALVTGCAQQSNGWNNQQWSWQQWSWPGQGDTNDARADNGGRARLASHAQNGRQSSTNPLLNDIHVANQTEIELAADVVRLRTHYVAALNDLCKYYVASGNRQKLAWCQDEIAEIARVKPRPYVQDEAIAEFDLRAARSIGRADQLFDQALTRMQQGGYGQAVQPTMRSQPGQSLTSGAERERLVEAYDLLVQLIDRFPHSDKIDDAAFCCGEIVKECFPDRARDAIRWYERCVRWDPRTPHPAQLQIAVLYDFQLNRPQLALANYRAAVNRKGAGPDEVAVASARIESLVSSGRTSIERDGQTTSNGAQPAGDTMQDTTMHPDSESRPKPHQAFPVRQMDPMTPVEDGRAVMVEPNQRPRGNT